MHKLTTPIAAVLLAASVGLAIAQPAGGGTQSGSNAPSSATSSSTTGGAPSGMAAPTTGAATTTPSAGCTDAMKKDQTPSPSSQASASQGNTVGTRPNC